MVKSSYNERDYTHGAAMLTLRTAIGLTQAGLAERLRVSRQTVCKWEAGSVYPKAEHLKALIVLAIEHQAFPKGCEAEEIRVLWKAMRQKTPLDERWLSSFLSEGQAPEPPGGETSGEEARSSLPVSALGASELEVYVGRDQATLVRHNLPFSPNPFFTGRESELLQLQHLFKDGPRVAITQPVSVSGLGGIGKTQLALEYAHRYSPHRYQYVLWVNAENLATLQASYLSLAHLLQLPGQQEREVERIVQAVKSWLEKESRWLLILDNADDLELASSALPTRPRGHILLTTRSQIVGRLAAKLLVEALSQEEGLLFLLRRSRVLRSGAEPESLPESLRQEARALVELLGGHPLAIDQAGAYIEETREPSVEVSGASFAEYRQLYQQQHRVLLQRRGSLGGEHPETVAATLEISLQKAYELHPSCAEVLAFCSFLHPDAIPEGLLRNASGLDLDLLPFSEAIGALRRYSLLKRDSEKQVLSLHRLVQAVIRGRMETQTFRHWANSALQAVNDAFPETTFEQWAKCERYLPHALVSVSWVEQEAVPPLPASHLLSKAGTYLQGRGQYREAEPLLIRSLAIREQHLGAEHPDTATSLNNLAILYREQGKYELAEPLYQRSLAIREQHLGAEHPDTAKSLNNLAILYWQQGKYELAEPLHCRALRIYEQHLGAEHPDTATSLNNLANLYWQQGKYELAESLYQRSLAIREQHLGAEHPLTATSLQNLGNIYHAQGKESLAESLYQRSLAIREQHLGAEHPDTAESLNNLAEFYREQGKYELAEPLSQRTLAIWEQHLGAEHPLTATSLNNLAELYREQGKDEQAEPLYQRALAICEQRLGAERYLAVHPLQGLAELARHRGQYGQAEVLYQRSLSICERHLGADHPLTARVLRGLAELSEQRGNPHTSR